MKELSKGEVPTAWRKYPFPPDTTVSVWLIDFKQRIAQLDRIRESKDYSRSNIVFPPLPFPPLPSPSSILLQTQLATTISPSCRGLPPA